MLFSPELECLPLPALRHLQDERLRQQVQRLYDQVPFYRQQLDAASLTPFDIRGVEDLPRLPFTHKTDLRDQYPFGLLAVPQTELARIHCSSGTTGKPTVVGYTAGDVAVFTDVVARSLAAAGCRPGMKLHNAYGYGLFTGGLGLHYGAEKLGMAVVPVSGGQTDRQLLLLQDFAPEVICCTPSYAVTLAEEMRARNLSPDQLNLRYAVLGAEPWTETMRAQVEQGLGVKAVNIYGLSEIMGPGVSCEAVEERGTGSYVWEDHFFPEVVDRETGAPLPYGQPGVLVLTTLTKQAMPLLRYYTNDICTLHYDPNGRRTHIKMGPILGRADDMLIIRGVNLFHTQIEDVLRHCQHASPHYQLLASRRGSLDEVEVLLEVDDALLQALTVTQVTPEVVAQHPALAALQGQIAHRIKEGTGLSMQVTLVGVGEVPRSTGGKLNRVVDMRRS